MAGKSRGHYAAGRSRTTTIESVCERWYNRFTARPLTSDVHFEGDDKASAVIQHSYFAPFNHKPTSTNIAVLELGEPEQLIEIQMFAVVD
jgi:hypothetical protein